MTEERAPPSASSEVMAKTPLLSPNQRVMWRQALRQQTATMQPDDREAFVERATRELAALDPAALNQERGKWQAAWDALAPKRQERLKAKIAELRQKRLAEKAVKG